MRYVVPPSVNNDALLIDGALGGEIAVGTVLNLPAILKPPGTSMVRLKVVGVSITPAIDPLSGVGAIGGIDLTTQVVGFF